MIKETLDKGCGFRDKLCVVCIKREEKAQEAKKSSDVTTINLLTAEETEIEWKYPDSYSCQKLISSHQLDGVLRFLHALMFTFKIETSSFTKMKYMTTSSFRLRRTSFLQENIEDHDRIDSDQIDCLPVDRINVSHI